MLRLVDIGKIYTSGDSEVHALKGVSISFRKSEFVSVLGHSGCGKTTLLNIIGGLDHYTSGDLVINDISTKEYKDRDWDNYRNHSIGFVFQSYNLIPHQTVLGNVELALTLSGVKRTERKMLAQAALVKVGLADQIHKLPNQLSGGQMQRVAIARALVNNPDIILADEPTGALDTETSVQVMEILKEVAQDKLVIMVTHNPELAEAYSTRIVRLKDGEVISDSMPYDEAEESATQDAVQDAVPQEEETPDPAPKKVRKPSMSLWTAFSLSIRNLFTKKGRTFLTAFAGSIGIIGIALILSLSNGFQNYINGVERDALAGYPLEIHRQSTEISMEDMMAMFSPNQTSSRKEYPDEKEVYSNPLAAELLKKWADSSSVNDLKSFKEWLDGESERLGEVTNAVKYSYNTKFNVYGFSEGADGKLKDVKELWPINFSDLSSSKYQMFESTMNRQDIWEELVDDKEYLNAQYDVIEGHWPKAYDPETDDGVFEVVLTVDKYNRIYDYLLWSIGLMDIVKDIFGNLATAAPKTYSFDKLIGNEYKIILSAQQYLLNEDTGLWEKQGISSKYLRNVLANDSVTIRIAGIIRPKEGVNTGSMRGVIGYTGDLTQYMIEKSKEMQIIDAQRANTEVDVTTGKAFDRDFTYDEAMRALGYVDKDTPSTVHFYVKGFEEKEQLIAMIDEYNASVADTNPEKVVKYTDTVGMLMSSVNTIINAVSYVLIAFVSISLIVSSIMIGIITYISVLERTKEIGVLRSIGASKRDISRLFNAETLTIGLMSGLFGIIVTLLLNIPIGLLIYSLTGISGLAALPAAGGAILVAISMFLSFIAGFIPSKVAAKKDPVVALRTE